MTLFQRICVVAALLAFVVITMGAWVRLTDAGLGCPDWPGCFGQLTVPESQTEIADAGAAYPGIVLDSGKAWREMIHRYAASTLGLLIIVLAVIAVARRRHDPRQAVILPLLLVPVVIFQGLLGMWTVTLLLQPLVVLLHLLGGLTVLSLLTWLALRSRPGVERRTARGVAPLLAPLAAVAVLVQIMLGGWTSTNYAALACPDFPTCQNAWWPDADFTEAFVPWRPVESSFEGGKLLHPARVAIHLAHRIGALVVSALLLLLGWRLWRSGDGTMRRAAATLLAALVAQVGIGVSIIKYSLPLALGVAHNGTAALLLLAVVLAIFSLNYRRQNA